MHIIQCIEYNKQSCDFLVDSDPRWVWNWSEFVSYKGFAKCWECWKVKRESQQGLQNTFAKLEKTSGILLDAKFDYEEVLPTLTNEKPRNKKFENP